MAIELFIKGDFELSSHVRDALLDALGEGGRRLPDPSCEFSLESPLLCVTAVATSYGPLLILRVCDKGHAPAALTIAVGCIAGVLAADEGTIEVFRDEILESKKTSARVSPLRGQGLVTVAVAAVSAIYGYIKYSTACSNEQSPVREHEEPVPEPTVVAPK